MGREVRKVPATWQHPKDARGRYIPLMGSSYAKRLAEWEEEKAKWAEGFRRDYSNDGWRPLDADDDDFEGWCGARPLAENYMPDWPEAERTHLMMYEDTSEGTPISPAFATPEELARWLADNNASALGHQGASYEAWLAMAREGWAPSAAIIDGRMMSGVEVAALPR